MNDARPLQRRGAKPLWEQLHDDLIRRLAGPEFADSFPGEEAIREEYGVSRHTVREALRRLRAAGMVESGRGRRSQVRQRTIEQPLGSLYSLFREVEARGYQQRSEVLRCTVTRDAEAAQRLDLDTEEVFHLERLRFADEEPLAHDSVWLPREIGQALVGTDFSRTALYGELARHGQPIPDGGRERIVACLLGPEMASQLQVSVPAAGLCIERTGTRQGHPIEIRRSTVRADRYALLMSWTERGYDIAGDAR